MTSWHTLTSCPSQTTPGNPTGSFHVSFVPDCMFHLRIPSILGLAASLRPGFTITPPCRLAPNQRFTRVIVRIYLREGGDGSA